MADDRRMYDLFIEEKGHSYMADVVSKKKGKKQYPSYIASYYSELMKPGEKKNLKSDAL